MLDPPSAPPSPPQPPAYPLGAGAAYYHIEGGYMDLATDDSNWLGSAYTLTPVVYMDLLRYDWDPVDVCGYLCTNAAMLYPTRGACTQFYVDVMDLERPFGTLIEQVADCMFFNENATVVAADPPTWTNGTFEPDTRVRFTREAYSINHPPSPPAPQH